MKPRFKRQHRRNGGRNGGQSDGRPDGRNGGRNAGRNGNASRHPQQDLQPLPARPPQRESLPLKIDVTDGGIAFEVHVVPRSARSHVAGTHGDRLHVKVNAPPVEGAANQVVCATIAKALGVPQRQVSIVRGVASRMKRIQVDGIGEVEARKALAGDPV